MATKPNENTTGRYAVSDYDGEALEGRWDTYEGAYEEGYLSKYMLSGYAVIVQADDGTWSETEEFSDRMERLEQIDFGIDDDDAQAPLPVNKETSLPVIGRPVSEE